MDAGLVQLCTGISPVVDSVMIEGERNNPSVLF
jgi:hypothetical protein